MGNFCSVSLPCDAIVSHCWDSIFGAQAYVVNLQENLQELTRSLADLGARKNDVQTKVDVAVADPEQQLEPLEEVQNWISKAAALETQVNEVLGNGSQEIEKLCCGGHCSNNYWSSYKFGKQVAQKLKEVTDLMSKGVFQEVAAKSLNESVVKLQENLQALELSLANLRALKNDVQKRVAVAIADQLKPLDQVQNWISRVEAVETQVYEVVSNSSNNYRSSYEFGKQVTKKLKEVTDLMNNGVFHEVATKRLDESAVDERPSEPTVGMKSMFEEVWRHFENEEVGVIGLYGMGGVGKTTLLTEIHNHICRTRNDFNFVLWIDVNKDHKLEILQDKIGEKIRVSSDEWKRKEVLDKAQDIFKKLSEKKFVLLLDDIWEPVEIIKLGIPFRGDRNKSKIIFTTRLVEICGHMEAQQTIKVRCLTPDKAWSLFQEKVTKETLQVHPDIPQLAKIVADECDGLPLALITIGRAMASKKTPERWNYEIDVLRKSASEFSGMPDQVFRFLKFSYDNLPSEKIKACLLYCALFPEDFVIDMDDLLYLWMCEEILDECDNVDKAKNESYDIIGILLDACLLEDVGDGSVKMHDVIHDMALWLACDCGKEKTNILVDSTGLHKALDVEKWEKTKRVSLVKSRTACLVEIPKFPNLLTLLLRNCGLKMIDNGYFEDMPILRVLDLSQNMKITQLPSGISKLVSLQHLNLSATGIRELPIELKDCVMLKYLNLEWTEHLEFVPPNLISSLKRLKVLRMHHCGNGGDEIVFGNGEIRERCSKSNSNSMMVVIDEIEGLKELEFLSLSIYSTSCFRRLLLNYPKLVTNNIIRELRLQSYFMTHDQSRRLDISSLKDMKRLESLEIEFAILEEFEVSWGGRGGEAATDNNDDDHIPRRSTLITTFSFIALKCVVVYTCPKLKNMTWLIFAPNLIKLSVFSCFEMEKIIDLERLGGVADEDVRQVLLRNPPFAKLTTLVLFSLPKLTSIYETALPFPYLKEINVRGCPALKKLPLKSSTIAPQTCNTLNIFRHESWWNALEWDEDDSSDGT